MDLKDVTDEVLREIDAAVRDLRRKYDGERQEYRLYLAEDDDESSNCPLCRLSKHLIGDWCSKFCPWIIIEGRNCLTAPSYFSQDEQARSSRINRWERLIEAEFKRRGVCR
jgi:hypothetical protein